MTGRIEKTVFISYRRTNLPWALAIYQDLTHHGYDVFFDYLSIDSGNFEKVILENIRSRAHFLVVLTPSALERCQEPDDWLRREIETAIDENRNIVPLMVENFDFGSPSAEKVLTGKLATLQQFNGLHVPSAYFLEAMGRLRDRYLDVTLHDIALPSLNAEAKKITEQQRIAASEANQVEKKELTAQEWFERGYVFQETNDLHEAFHAYVVAIRLKPDLIEAYDHLEITWKKLQSKALQWQQDRWLRIMDVIGIIVVSETYPVDPRVMKVGAELLEEVRKSSQLLYKLDFEFFDTEALRKISQWNQLRWLRVVALLEKVLSAPYPPSQVEIDFVKELLKFLKEISYQITKLAASFFDQKDLKMFQQWHQDRWLRIVDVVEQVLSSPAYPRSDESWGVLQELITELEEPNSKSFEQDTTKLENSVSREVINRKEQLTAEEWYQQGKAFQESDHFFKAIHCYIGAIRLNPSLDDAVVNLEVVGKRLQNRDTDWLHKKWHRTIDAFERILRATTSYPHDPRDVEIIRTLLSQLRESAPQESEAERPAEPKDFSSEVDSEKIDVLTEALLSFLDRKKPQQ